MGVIKGVHVFNRWCQWAGLMGVKCRHSGCESRDGFWWVC